jgi:hypothetical protein
MILILTFSGVWILLFNLRIYCCFLDLLDVTVRPWRDADGHDVDFVYGGQGTKLQ